MLIKRPICFLLRSTQLVQISQTFFFFKVGLVIKKDALNYDDTS